MIQLVCFHGWGLAPAFWMPLIREFASRNKSRNEPVVGFSAPQKSNLRDSSSQPSQPWIAIGHSLGFAKLLGQLSNLARPPVGLVAINGFTHFCKSETLPIGTDPRIINRMLRAFENDPLAVLNQFYINCGLETGKAGGDSTDLNLPQLKSDLSLLQTINQSKQLGDTPIPLLVLAGGIDKIVSPELTESCFPTDQIIWHKTGGHAIPFNHPAWCAEKITPFINQF